MSNNEYILKCLRTNTDAKISISEANEQLLHAVLGIQTESGELTDNLKKHIFYGKPLDVANLKEECGDLLWYISLLLDWLDCSYEEIMLLNIEKLQIRYPEKFSKHNAINRDLKSEEKVFKKHMEE